MTRQPKGRSYNWRIRPRQLFPRLEATPDINRGEERLVAEVMLAQILGEAPPNHIVLRAIDTLRAMALQ